MKVNNKDGNYSLTSIDYDAWFKGEKSVNSGPNQSSESSKPKKSRSTKKIVHPIFAQCINYTNDPFWKKHFNNWSGGKIPKNFSLIGTTLRFNKKNRIIEENLSDDPEVCTQQCINFFRSHGYYYSTKDEKTPPQITNDSEEEFSDEEVNWGNISNRKQEILIINYVNDMADILKLNKQQSCQLLQTIKLGICYKLFHKGNILIEDSKIVDIKDLKYNENKVFKVYTNAITLNKKSNGRNKQSVSRSTPGSTTKVSSTIKSIPKDNIDDSLEEDFDVCFKEYSNDMKPNLNVKFEKFKQYYNEKK